MPTELPKIKYKGKKCTVDFRLGEMRCGARSIKFTKLKGSPKKSKIKLELRKLRFEHWHNDFIEGIDT